jgi:hypothetical protein
MKEWRSGAKKDYMFMEGERVRLSRKIGVGNLGQESFARWLGPFEIKAARGPAVESRLPELMD